MFQQGISKPTQDGLAILSQVKFVGEYFLAGGTACALYLGHRLSFDLDFFSAKPVEPRIIIKSLKDLGKVEVYQNDEGTFNGKFNQVKLSFFVYPYRMLFPFREYCGVKMADLKDIACMKLDAISRRGTKRDFIDLFFICKQFNLGELLKLFEKKFEKLNVPIWHVIKSLIYFEDAERDELPEMLKSVNWEEVKQYFEVQVKQLAQEAGLI